CCGSHIRAKLWGMWEAVTRLQEAATACATSRMWALPDAEVLACLDAIHAVEQTLTAAKARLVRQVATRDLPRTQGATNTTVWVRDRLRVSVHTARRLTDLAHSLDQRPTLDAAVRSGAVNAEQATVIATTVTQLPAELGAETVDKAEQLLIEDAAEFEPGLLRKLATRILWHVAPEVAEKTDRAAVEREERRAYEGRAFTLSPTGDGRVRVHGWLDREAAATVNAALDPLCNPRTATMDDQRSIAQRRADALVEVCELALRTDELPDHGGQRPHVVVTVDFDVLRKELGAGTLDTGEPLTPEQVRRIACDANLLPAVLNTHGQVLDLGTARRLFTGAVRRALILRDGGCAFPGCDRPPRWSQGHHIHPASLGGPTSLANGVLVCGHHHRTLHEGHWQVRIAADGLLEFIPPTHLDTHHLLFR